jgi:ribosomal protein S9
MGWSSGKKKEKNSRGRIRAYTGIVIINGAKKKNLVKSQKIKKLLLLLRNTQVRKMKLYST